MHVQTNYDPILNEHSFTCHYKTINAAEEQLKPHIIVVLIEFRTFKKPVDDLKASTEVWQRKLIKLSPALNKNKKNLLTKQAGKYDASA